jgi:uncharacterized ParB-like nuclease family protein
VSHIKIAILRLDYQASECLLEERVQERMQEIADGHPMEPILVRFDGESYFVYDGFHRVEAARRSGIVEIDAEVSPGTLQEMEEEYRKYLDALRTELRSGAGPNPESARMPYRRCVGVIPYQTGETRRAPMQRVIAEPLGIGTPAAKRAGVPVR